MKTALTLAFCLGALGVVVAFALLAPSPTLFVDRVTFPPERS